MKNVRQFAYFLSLLFFGCQTVVVPPDEFPTIDSEKDLHIVVGNSFADYPRFRNVLVDAFTELQYPGQLVVHRWSEKVDDTVPKVEIVIESWGPDESSDTWCVLHLSLYNEGVNTSMESVFGKYEGVDSWGDAFFQNESYTLAAKGAIKAFYDRFLPYTNLGN